MSLSFKYTTRVGDEENLQLALKNYLKTGDVNKTNKFKDEMFFAFYFLFGVVVCEFASEILNLRFNVLSFLIGYFYLMFLLHYRTRKLSGHMNPKTSTDMAEESEFTLDNEGFRIESEKSSAKLSWDLVKDLQEDNDYLYIFLESYRGLNIPKRYLESEELCKEIISFIKSKIKKNNN